MLFHRGKWISSNPREKYRGGKELKGSLGFLCSSLSTEFHLAMIGCCIPWIQQAAYTDSSKKKRSFTVYVHVQSLTNAVLIRLVFWPKYWFPYNWFFRPYNSTIPNHFCFSLSLVLEFLFQLLSILSKGLIAGTTLRTFSLSSPLELLFPISLSNPWSYKCRNHPSAANPILGSRKSGVPSSKLLCETFM